MRKLLSILICKLARLVGAALGRGSSLPGKLALKVCPDVLSRLTLPPYVVAVTGSNGKTSTVELIAHILRESGKTVAYNKEGSNQIEGVATLLLTQATLGGRVKADVVLLESDERFARHTFRHFQPTHYVILDLFRDQMTRNGHPQWMFDIVAQSVYPASRLILNADDPMVARYGLGRDNVVWFGIQAQATDAQTSPGAYDDGAFCPACLHPMAYTFRHFNHVGGYTCSNCGLTRPEPQYRGQGLDLARGVMAVNGQSLRLALPSYYHAYNTLAALAACAELGVPLADGAAALDGYLPQNGRVVSFTLNGRPGTLLTSKHENSVSYDQSIRAAIQSGEDCAVLVIVDAISRKYFTSETSWLWDVDFEALGAECVKNVVLAGRYCHDLAVRFQFAGVDPGRVTVLEDIGDAAAFLGANARGHIYVITCFSDKDKLLSLVEVKS